MDAKGQVITTIDDYIAGFPANVQALLNEVRAAIHAAAPEARETISYSMPAFEQHGILVYFGAFKQHISLFPTASGVEAFKNELGVYTSSKGTVQFPLNQPIPYELIGRITAYRVAENQRKAAAKKSGSRKAKKE